MPVTIPPFSQFQGQLIPLRGLWNKRPPEGDMFVNMEIDWGTANTSAVQIALSGNSPVAMSQIAALYVDNRRCGVDCDFQFPDSGFLLTVPAHAQGLFPVLTNALMFYVVGVGSTTNDVSIVQILNSIPPPLALLPTAQQNNASVAGITVAPGTTALVASGISGTIATLAFSISLASAGGGSVTFAVQDGATGGNLWSNIYQLKAGESDNFAPTIPNLAVRFKSGLNLVITGGAGVTGFIDANVYYTTP
jgi:hypothetical protein